MSQVANPLLNHLSPICNHCLTFFKPKSYLEALATSNSPRTATASVLLKKQLSDVAQCAQWCVICKIILQNTQNYYDDESPDIEMEFICGTESHDIKRIRLSYQAPSGPSDSGFMDGYTHILQNYVVHSLPGQLHLRT